MHLNCRNSRLFVMGMIALTCFLSTPHTTEQHRRGTIESRLCSVRVPLHALTTRCTVWLLRKGWLAPLIWKHCNHCCPMQNNFWCTTHLEQCYKISFLLPDVWSSRQSTTLTSACFLHFLCSKFSLEPFR